MARESRVSRKPSGMIGCVMKKASMTRKSAAEGARVVVRLAVSPDLSGVTGRYFRETGEAASSLLSRDEALQEELWRLSARLTGLSP